MARELLASTSVNVILELYHEPTVTQGTPAAINTVKFNFAEQNDPETVAQLIESFVDGELACRTKLYGSGSVGNAAANNAGAEREAVFPAEAVIGGKIYAESGVGSVSACVKIPFYEHEE